ncbi:hypothetical protein SASPL_125838 [Salvia splendens]|uniref:Myb/SANT-like domain-containing protein n=1 Tax=Salvia splendens TaxID=180675 RepID=A0A8X8XFX8_SALSN|nr:uncharacterized protein LOC121747170 [Salvia splendens]KAG6413136.1 hypothetical protein SASPL_125838 [Salvia splendens]
MANSPAPALSMENLRTQFSLEDPGSQQMINDHLGRNRKRKGDRKGDRTRRSWTDREEETLVIALKDIVAHGWKSDNGFRGGYLTKLEDAMRSRFPKTDIKGSPHITSKLTAWKRMYGSLALILNRSGVGFNNKGDYKIDCNDDQWDQIVKADKDARFMRNKCWPYWEHWQVIFGKERASGTVAADYMDSVNDLHSLEQVQESIGAIGEQVIPDEQPSMDDQPTMDDQPSMDPLGGTPTPAGAANSTSHGGRANATSGSVGNKKKLSELGTDGLVHMLEKLHEDTNKRLDTLSLRIGYEFDLSKARKDVFQLLGRLPGLTREQKFDVGEILLEKVERLDFFLGMQDEDRSAYVLRALVKFM